MLVVRHNDNPVPRRAGGMSSPSAPDLSGGSNLHVRDSVAFVDGERRHRLAREVLDGCVSGPDAPVEATAAALARAESARAVVLVEGISDQMALETVASRHGRDLGAEGIVIVPIGGAHAVTRYLVRFGPEGAGLTIVGMCDAGEEHYFRRGLAAGGFGSSQNRIEMERLGSSSVRKTWRTN